MNELLKTIKENDKEFNKEFRQENTQLLRGKELDPEFIRDREQRMVRNKLRFEMKQYFTKSRIKELEALVKVIRKKEKLWGSDNIESDWQLIGYNEAIFDITEFLKDTIKNLKN